MSPIANSITDLIGKTPLLALNGYSALNALSTPLLAKLEYFNPAGSVKDRVALAMINDAEARGLLKKGSVIIEPTSGNTGIGLASVAAARGYRVILTMPETMSIERRRLLAAYGAEIVLTEGAKGMNGAIERANELAAEHVGAYLPAQFDNPTNPQAHRDTTGPEIWADTDGTVDILVSGIGTGGTITGVGSYLKSQNPAVRVVGVEPFDSPLLTQKRVGAHGLQGIGANFVPSVLDREILDEIITVKTDDAYRTSREIAHNEGLLVGITSGAATFAATQLALRAENHGKRIVVILPDTGERYLSTPMFE